MGACVPSAEKEFGTIDPRIKRTAWRGKTYTAGSVRKRSVLSASGLRHNGPASCVFPATFGWQPARPAIIQSTTDRRQPSFKCRCWAGSACIYTGMDVVCCATGPPASHLRNNFNYLPGFPFGQQQPIKHLAEAVAIPFICFETICFQCTVFAHLSQRHLQKADIKSDTGMRCSKR